MRPEEEVVNATLAEAVVRLVDVVEGFVVAAFPNVPGDREEDGAPYLLREVRGVGLVDLPKIFNGRKKP